jgi:acetylxylan esterase
MPKLRPHTLRLLPLGLLLAVARPAFGAELQEEVDYGGSGAIMNLYVPDAVDAVPAIVVSLHYCTGSARNALSWFTSLSEQYGFIVIAPGLLADDADGCWDVGSSEALSHDGGSHSKAIVEMVEFTLQQYGADPSRVFAAGASSGAMMTNVLLGAYPDVFAAGSVLAGVPFGCWTAADGWTSACANGSTRLTPEEWGNRVRDAFPGYDGNRPRVQLFHGTADATLDYANLAEEVEQWTNVLGLASTPTSTQEDSPKTGWTRSYYEDESGTVLLEVSVGEGVGHDLTGRGLWSDVIRFFGLGQDAPAGGDTLGNAGAGAGGAAAQPAGTTSAAAAASDTEASTSASDGASDDAGCSCRVRPATSDGERRGFDAFLAAALAALLLRKRDGLISRRREAGWRRGAGMLRASCPPRAGTRRSATRDS